MNPPPLPRRAPAVHEKLQSAEGVLSELEAAVGAFALEAAEGKAGAEKALAGHRSKIELAERQVSEMRRAVALAERLDREADAGAAALMRANQLAEFKSAMKAREAAMAKILEAAAVLAAHFGTFSEATLRAQIATPSGTAVPTMAMGPNGIFGPAFGPCSALILAELYRLAPERKDGAGRFVVPFAKPSSEIVRNQPNEIPAGIAEFLAADAAILANIEGQIERLNAEGAARAREAA